MARRVNNIAAFCLHSSRQDAGSREVQLSDRAAFMAVLSTGEREQAMVRAGDGNRTFMTRLEGW
jgi:hypothetical protein